MDNCKNMKGGHFMKKMLSVFLASALLVSMATMAMPVSAATDTVTNGEKVVTIWDGSNIPDGSIIEKTTDLGPDGTTPWFSIDANKRAGSYVLSLNKAAGTVKATVHKYTSAVAPIVTEWSIPYIKFNTNFASFPCPDATGADAFQFYYDGTNFSSTDQPYFTLEFDLNDVNADGTPRFDTVEGVSFPHIACWDASTAVYYQDSSSNWISSPVDSSYMFKLPIQYKGWIKISMSNFDSMGTAWGAKYGDLDNVFTPIHIKDIALMVSGIKDVNDGKSFEVGNLRFLVPQSADSSSSVASTVSTASTIAAGTTSNTSSVPIPKTGDSNILVILFVLAVSGSAFFFVRKRNKISNN
jgi:LPXTG-motif cell wall-anchored protein